MPQIIAVIMNIITKTASNTATIMISTKRVFFILFAYIYHDYYYDIIHSPYYLSFLEMMIEERITNLIAAVTDSSYKLYVKYHKFGTLYKHA